MSEPGADTEADREALRLRVARAYYLEDRSKVQIAADTGLSRFQVARLLDDARSTGLVRIEIGPTGGVDEALSSRLRSMLDLPRVVVVRSSGSASAPSELGRVLADELAREVRVGDTLGLTWSRATAAMSACLRELPRCDVVQLAGAVYPPAGMPGSVEVARRVALAAGGHAHAIYSPLVLPDRETAEGMRRQPEVEAVLRRATFLDVAVLSVGAWAPLASAVFDLLEERERDDLAAAGVCGEVSGRLLDADGRVLSTWLDDRVLGIDAAGLKRVPRLLVSSHGAHRAAATRAVVRAGLAHTLVVDVELAEALLDGPTNVTPPEPDGQTKPG